MKAWLAPTEHLAWLIQRTGAALTPGAHGLEAVDRAGRTRGMVVFDGWTPGAALAHIALDTPLALRCLMPAATDYLFNVVGREMAIGLIPSFNERSLALAARLGFSETYRIRDGWSLGVDLVVHELRRPAARRHLKEAA